MNALILRLELRRTRVLLFWLALTSVLYAGLMGWFYPRMVEDTKAIEDMLKIWPKEMLAAFSIEGNMTDQGTFVNVYVFSMIWPIVAAIGAILIPTRTLGADLERGFLELPLATPVSRARYLLDAIVVQIVAMALLSLATVLAIVGAFAIVGVSFDLGRYLAVGVLAFAFGCAIAAATTLLSVLTLSRGTSGGLVAGVLLVMYLGQTVSRLAPELSNVAYLSIFHYLYPPPIVNNGTLPASDLAVLSLAAIVCWGAAVLRFRGRELVA